MSRAVNEEGNDEVDEESDKAEADGERRISSR